MSEIPRQEYYRNILRADKLSSNAKLVIMELLQWTWNKNYCWPSQTTIAKALNISNRSVIRGIQELLDHSLIITKRTNTGNVYFLNFAEIKDLCPESKLNNKLLSGNSNQFAHINREPGPNIAYLTLTQGVNSESVTSTTTNRHFHSDTESSKVLTSKSSIKYKEKEEEKEKEKKSGSVEPQLSHLNTSSHCNKRLEVIQAIDSELLNRSAMMVDGTSRSGAETPMETSAIKAETIDQRLSVKSANNSNNEKQKRTGSLFGSDESKVLGNPKPVTSASVESPKPLPPKSPLPPSHAAKSQESKHCASTDLDSADKELALFKRRLDEQDAIACLDLLKLESEKKYGPGAFPNGIPAKEKAQIKNLIFVYDTDSIISMIRLLVWDWEAIRGEVWPYSISVPRPQLKHLIQYRVELASAISTGFPYSDSVRGKADTYSNRYLTKSGGNYIRSNREKVSSDAPADKDLENKPNTYRHGQLRLEF